MAWFKKKKESEDIIPELPGLLEGGEALTEKDEEYAQEQEESQDMYNEEAIPEPVLQELEKESEKPEVKEAEPEKVAEIPRERSTEGFQKKQVPETQFVRLDKFEAAYSSIANIKKKLEEMNIFLKDIRQLNEKEDAELSAWEKEINDIRVKIENIDKALFENLE